MGSQKAEDQKEKDTTEPFITRQTTTKPTTRTKALKKMMIHFPFSLIAAVVVVATVTGSSSATTTTPNGPTNDGATKCFDEQITRIMDANGIPGANVGVMRRGQVVYAQGYGTRDAPGVGLDDENNRPALPSTPFRAQSISKSVTGSLVVILAQEGLLQLDDVVFGGGVGEGGSSATETRANGGVDGNGVLHYMTLGHEDKIDPLIYDITIRQLLRHSAGFTPLLDMNNPFSDPTYSSTFIATSLGKDGRPASCDDNIQYMLDVPLLYKPDTTYEYSNFGYCVLEHVSLKL